MATYSTHGITVEFQDNSPIVLAALKNATRRGLEACGAMAESYAKQELSKSKPFSDNLLSRLSRLKSLDIVFSSPFANLLRVTPS